jgi:ribose/xylose/arabinose/galactoside ABC-type transport system permease subunit
MKKNQKFIPWNSLAPLILIAALIIFFSIISGGKLTSPATLISILTQSLGFLIAGMGMIFVMSLGDIDMSIGINMCISSTLAYTVAGEAGWVPVILLAMVFGLIIGTINAFLVSVFHVQGFMVTIALQIGLRGAVKGIMLMLPSGRIMFNQQVMAFNSLPIKLIIVAVVAVVCIYLLEFSRFGSRLKAIGENETCAQMSGIRVGAVKAGAYIICALLAGLSGLFLAIRTGGISSDTGSGCEMTVMLGLFLAGVPVEGGMETKIYKVFIGVPCLMAIQSGLNVVGVDVGMYQFVEGVILLGAIILSDVLKKYCKRRDEKIMAAMLAADKK